MQLDPFFSDAVLIKPRILRDERGYFTEVYRADLLQELGPFVQENESFSNYGVIRGLHFQSPPYVQAKLVRVVEGEIYDVIVDLRRSSPFFGQHAGVILSADNHQQLFVPAGFAHGFSVLSPTAKVIYKCSHVYRSEADAGIFYADPSLGIDWKIPEKARILSEKDRTAPHLDYEKTYFP